MTCEGTLEKEMQKRGYSLWDKTEYGIFYKKMEADNGLYCNLIMFKDWDCVRKFVKGY